MASQVALDHLQQPAGGADSLQQIGDSQSPYLTSIEAARYLRFPSIRAFYRWLETSSLPRCHRGRVLLFERRVLDAFVRGEDWTKKSVTVR